MLHDTKILHQEFKVGDLVMIYNESLRYVLVSIPVYNVGELGSGI